MQQTINVPFPADLANNLHMNVAEFKHEILFNAVIKLFERDKISTTVAAKTLGISRIEFLEKISGVGVPVIQDLNFEELNEDLLNA